MLKTTILPLLALLVGSHANIVSELSFGLSGKLSPDGSRIPGWTLSAIGHHPQILSDRVALTPPYPGNAKGALWADGPVPAQTWMAEFEFRAAGQERASSNVAFWYVQNQYSVHQNSVYTVDKFDGLAIVIDQYGGKGGSVRGFLNDGSKSFNQMTNLDSLAFGHCDFAYRNLGRPSKVRVDSNQGLTVFVDDKLCFASEQINLPGSYTFGLTATSADNPDTVEVFKFTARTNEPHEPRVVHHFQNQQAQQNQQQQAAGQQNQHAAAAALPGAPEVLPDRAADEFKSSAAQFEDLHNRLQSLQHQLADMNAQFEFINKQFDSKAQEIIQRMPQIPTDTLSRLNTRMENTERIVQAIQKDIEGKDYSGHFRELNEAMANVKGGLTDALPDTIGKIVTSSTPRFWTILFVLIAVQIMLFGGYIVYKRRRASAPKKYL